MSALVDLLLHSPSPLQSESLREYNELRERVAYLEEENKTLILANRDCFDWFNALNSDHQKALKTLDELARLGNGTAYGNSPGNEIAQRCIASFID
jgi:hypothetical protein